MSSPSPASSMLATPRQVLHVQGPELARGSSEEISFASGVPCYVEAGFCERIQDDRLLVLQAIDAEDPQPLRIETQADSIDRCAE